MITIPPTETPQRVCPKAKDCKDLGCPESFPHIKDYCLKRIDKSCPACIPVPSTPSKSIEHIQDGGEEDLKLTRKMGELKLFQSLPPDELLTKLREQIAEIICKKLVKPQSLKQRFSNMPSGVREYYLDIADSVLLKCRQSEAAELDCLQCAKDLEIQFRADQTRKAWLEIDDYFAFNMPMLHAQLQSSASYQAKLQKGEGAENA